jgi:hypothetical protein
MGRHAHSITSLCIAIYELTCQNDFTTLKCGFSEGLYSHFFASSVVATAACLTAFALTTRVLVWRIQVTERR